MYHCIAHSAEVATALDPVLAFGTLLYLLACANKEIPKRKQSLESRFDNEETCKVRSKVCLTARHVLARIRSGRYHRARFAAQLPEVSSDIPDSK